MRKVESIFEEGKGSQWDPEVIDAYFRVRDEILAISKQERADLQLDVEQWS